MQQKQNTTPFPFRCIIAQFSYKYLQIFPTICTRTDAKLYENLGWIICTHNAKICIFRGEVTEENMKQSQTAEK
jgi:hypothetical protein